MRKILFFSLFILFAFSMNAQTWTQQNTNMPGTSTGVDQVSVVDSNVVWVNGFNGSSTTNRIKAISRTQNGGTTWTAGTYNGFGTTVFPNVLTAVSYNKAFAVAMDTVSSVASFWKTTDGGANWSLVTGVMNTGSTTFADGVLFWDANNGFCYGDPVAGKFDIYYTTDGGTTWTPTLAANVTVPISGEFGYNGYECAAKLEGGTAVFITNMGRVYKTTNYGVNWAITTTAPFTAITTGKIYITGTGKIIAAGILTGGTALTWKQSTDGGVTWTTYAPTGTFYQYAMTYVPYSGNMLVASSPYSTLKGVSYSNNDGASFTDFTNALLQPTAGTNIQCLGVGFSDLNHGWVGNYATTLNGILKYTNNASPLSSAAEILTFTTPNQVGSSVVNSTAATVTINVPFGTAVTALVPTITLSTGATVNPASGVAQNFTAPKQFTVTAQNGTTTKIWTVTVNVNVGVDAYSLGNIISVHLNQTD
ncbi:MAG: hypothetical protein NTZ33_04080 [Bacteroidetes bacterium]|nr:hypothetical protein [Bacteroidota bacterium]